MKNLKQIIHIVKNIKLKPSDFITTYQKSDTKLNSFYNKLLNNEFSSDEEAAIFFYQAPNSNTAYKNLKSNLRKKLINTIYFYESNEKHNKRENAFIFCNKQILAAKILTRLGARSAGTKLYISVLKKAQEYEFTENIIEACIFLRSHFAYRQSDQTKFQLYNDLTNHHYKERGAELLAGEYYLKLLIPYTKNKALDANTHQEADIAFKQLNPLLSKFTSPYLHYLTYYIETIKYISINDYGETLKVCEKAIQFFNQKKYVYKSALKAFHHQQIICFIQLKKYEAGKEAMEKSLSLVKAGSYNWYINLDLGLLLAFHNNEYQEAYYTYNRAVNNNLFSSLNQGLVEKFEIYKAYIHFLIFTNKIKPIRSDKNFTKFRMGKFINSVPKFSKDKRGLNIPILVIQIVFMIVTKDNESAINRIGAIEKYCSRYLRKDQNFRSNCFIKMLLEIPRSDFHKIGVERNTKQYLEKLNNTPLEIAKQAAEIEIIPYEELWKIIFDSIDSKFHK